jgi:hypothetical protein
LGLVPTVTLLSCNLMWEIKNRNIITVILYLLNFSNRSKINFGTLVNNTHAKIHNAWYSPNCSPNITHGSSQDSHELIKLGIIGPILQMSKLRLGMIVTCRRMTTN